MGLQSSSLFTLLLNLFQISLYFFNKSSSLTLFKMVGKKALTSLLDKNLGKIQKVDEEFSKQRDFKGIKCPARQKKRNRKIT